MAKKPTAPPDEAAVSQLVTKALVSLAAGPGRLTGKGDTAPVFPSANAAVKAAVARLTATDAPLVEPVDATKGAPVRMTRAGFDAVLPHLPEDKAAAATKAIAPHLGLHDRVDLVRGVLSRTPSAAAELIPVLEEAKAALAAETEAAAAAAAARHARVVAEEAALARAIALLKEIHAARLAGLRRVYEAEGGNPTDLRTPADLRTAAAAPAARAAAPLAPATPEEHGFRREVIRRLAAAWREAFDLGRTDPARFLEAGIGNVRGVRQVGDVGEAVRFDGEFHEADEGISTGAAARVVRPGWTIDEDDDRRFVVLKAKVAR